MAMAGFGSRLCYGFLVRLQLMLLPVCCIRKRMDKALKGVSSPLLLAKEVWLDEELVREVRVDQVPLFVSPKPLSVLFEVGFS